MERKTTADRKKREIEKPTRRLPITHREPFMVLAREDAPMGKEKEKEKEN